MSSVPNYITIELEPAIPDDALDRFEPELRKALLIRKVEQRLLALFSEGKLFGTVHTCIGQEFVGVSVARALQPQDTIFSNHRGHGHFLARTGDIVGLIGEVMGKSIGVCAGRGGSQHLCVENYYSNGIQGGIAPVATGLGFAHQLRQNGAISVVFIGDGTLGEGTLYESLNLASRLGVPVLFVCENNLFAQSTCQTQTLAGDICARAAAFGIETAHSNTWNWPGLFEDMAQSVERVRTTGKPLFHRVDTFRLMAHSKGDDNRPAEYVECHRSRDPLNALNAEFGDDPRWQALAAEIDREVEQAVTQADAAPFDDLDVGPHAAEPKQHAWRSRQFTKERVVQSLQRGLADALRQHPEMILLGEDIESPYGGAFKATMGLSSEFPGRVRNTPISEAGIVGLGNGLALAGMRPVIEIMFGDFMTLALDQWLNHAAKFRFMFNDKVRVPLIVRTPMGGKRGYAATHSQSIEKHFLGVPDTQVLCLHHRYSPAELYRTLFATIDRPTLVIENKILYGQSCTSEAPAGFQLLFDESDPYPTVRLKPRVTPEITIVAVGGMSIDTEQAVMRLFEEEEIAAELFLPSRLYPFDVDVLAESLSQTRRLLVVEEGQGFVSFSGELIAQAAERFAHFGLICRRVAAAPIPIPAARPLERLALPDVDQILAKAKEVVHELVH